MEIAISPEKELFLRITDNVHDCELRKAFNKNPISGLLELIKSPEYRRRSPSTLFWHGVATEIFKTFCSQMSANKQPLTDGEVIARHTLHCPPFFGSEYLDQSFLRDLWDKLNHHLLFQVKEFSGDFEIFIQENYPDWTNVGKIHFHLAENNKGGDNPFVFLATYSTRTVNRARIQHIPLGKYVKNLMTLKKSRQLISVLETLREVASLDDFLFEFISCKRIYKPTLFSNEEAYQFIRALTVCNQVGIIVKLPDSFQGKPPDKVKVAVSLGKTSEKSFVGFHNMFQFFPRVKIGDYVLDKNEHKALMSQDDKLCLVQGKWVEFNKEKIESLLKKWQKATFLQNQGLTFSQALRALARANISQQDTLVQEEAVCDTEGFLEFTQTPSFAQTMAYLRNPSLIPTNKNITSVLSKELKANLRTYQLVGVNWLTHLSQCGMGACLADDMGLGKTIQIISLLLVDKNLSKRKMTSLLVVPASLLGNWQKEITKFAPSLRIKILHQSQIPQKEIYDFQFHIGSIDVVIVTYGLVKIVQWLKEHEWNFIIADEAQAIKNHQSQQSRSLKKIPGRIKIAMTGTPIENSLADLWSVFEFCSPTILGKYDDFTRFEKKLKESKDYSSLKILIEPWILRRKKTDKATISDLPEKTELKSYCFLLEDQVRLYRNLLDEMKQQLQESNSGAKRKASVLKYLTKFKQLCNHPSQLNSDNAYEYNKSGKFFKLKEIAETIFSRGEKLLIFTQFRELTDIIQNFLTDMFACKGLVLHGGTPVKNRIQIVDDFQNDYLISFLVLSIKAGGTGLNLTRASHVIHFDRWWNPAVENQATDRAFRLGQKRNVIVHKFICRGTIEEKIDLMIESKQNLVTQIFEKSGTIGLTELTNEQLWDLIKLDDRMCES